MRESRSRKSQSTAKGRDTHARILGAAQALVQERGYASLSISAICARANVAPTSIYWHFGDKTGLLKAILEQTSGTYVKRIRDAVTKAAGDPPAQLDIMIEQVRDLVTTQPLGSLSFVALLSDAGEVSDELRAALVDAHHRELAVIAQDFEQALGEDEGRAAALKALAFVNYAALTYRVTKDDREVDEILSALKDELLRSYAGRPPATL